MKPRKYASRGLDFSSVFKMLAYSLKLRIRSGAGVTSFRFQKPNDASDTAAKPIRIA